LNIVVKYTAFAGVAICLNLIAQYVSFLIYTGEFSLYLAMTLGTLVGLVSKYYLDKNYIFYHKTESYVNNGKKFILYSLTGVFTTVIFWGAEVVFDALSSLPEAKYIGASIGLSVGYFCKYFLDRYFTFRSKR